MGGRMCICNFVDIGGYFGNIKFPPASLSQCVGKVPRGLNPDACERGGEGTRAMYTQLDVKSIEAEKFQDQQLVIWQAAQFELEI